MGEDIELLICEKCHGTGWTNKWELDGTLCTECLGYGAVYCCDGLQEQAHEEEVDCLG